MGGGNNENRAIDLEDMPENLDFDYSSLMGLLATNGASLQLGKNWHWDYHTVYLRLSHTNLEFLHWISHMFNGPHFPFGKKFYYKVESSNTMQIGAKPSRMAYILWLHWNDSDIHLLPNHFSEYFNIRTLATWAMRNGQWKGNAFIIHVNRLNESEKALLISLIKDKLGYDSHLTMKDTKLAISSPAKLVQELKPLFHDSQLHRLIKKS